VDWDVALGAVDRALTAHYVDCALRIGKNKSRGPQFCFGEVADG